MNTIHITIDGVRLTVPAETDLRQGLLAAGKPLTAPCGGGGRCGKCRVRVLEGNAPVTAGDRRFFSDAELAQGWRLACGLAPSDGMILISGQARESGFEALSTGRENAGADESDEKDVAIDIGTTTVALEILSGSSGAQIDTAAGMNSQRTYGADVITRILAATQGRGEAMRQAIQSDLRQAVQTLLERNHIPLYQLRRISVAGNTTMGHLLMGYDCSGLGVVPFTPVNIGWIRGSAESVLGLPSPAEVTLLPGISTYVGGDIVSGLYACGFDQADETCMLIDLGTNGEMAIGNKERILVTSTAAGPAFEGGNIQWGIGSVPGAISGVRIENGKAALTTIQGKPPVGICGTGVIETTAELLRNDLIDETGRMDEDVDEEGFPLGQTPDGSMIRLTQKDVREIQLAKAAIRAGIEVLTLRYGMEKSRICRIYVAGGFGFRLDMEKAMAIGMFPTEFAGRLRAVGNSSLAGAEKVLTHPDAKERIDAILSVSNEISLSEDPAFQDAYMDAMMFE